jgi:DDE superfamily endonuclease
MNLQVIASPDGDILWVSGPLPGATHELTAARIWGIVRELAVSGLIVLADKGHTASASTCASRKRGRTSPRSRRTPTWLMPGSALPANALTPSQICRIVHKLRCCPWRAGQLAKAIHVLQTREIGG